MDRRRFLTGAGLFLAAGGLPLGRAQGRAPKGVNGGGFYRFRHRWAMGRFAARG